MIGYRISGDDVIEILKRLTNKNFSKDHSRVQIVKLFKKDGSLLDKDNLLKVALSLVADNPSLVNFHAECIEPFALNSELHHIFSKNCWSHDFLLLATQGFKNYLDLEKVSRVNISGLY